MSNQFYTLFLKSEMFTIRSKKPVYITKWKLRCKLIRKLMVDKNIPPAILEFEIPN